MTTKSKDLIVIFCPPLSSFPEQPIDQSKCELIDCKHCNEKMWISEKKQGVLELARSLGKDFFLSCYDCFVKAVNEDSLNPKKIIKVELSKGAV